MKNPLEVDRKHMIATDELEEDELKKTQLHKTFLNSFYKIVVQDNNTTYRRVEIVQLTKIENKANSNTDEQKLTFVTKLTKPNEQNYTYEFPEVLSETSFFLFQKVNRPMEIFPILKTTTPKILRSQHHIYIAAMSMKALNQVGSGAVALTYVNAANHQKKIAMRYYPHINSKLLSTLAMDGAIKFIKKYCQVRETDNTVIFTQESDIFHNMTRNISNSTRGQHRTLVEKAKANVNITSTSFVLLAKTEQNPAIDVATKTLSDAGNRLNTTKGFIDVFEPAPVSKQDEAAKELAKKQQHEQIARDAAIQQEGIGMREFINAVTTMDDFIKITSINTRQSVPSGSSGEWAKLVKMATTKVLDTKEMEEKSLWLRGLIMLPSMYLPARASITQIGNHMSKQTPFTLEESTKKSDKNNQQSVTKSVLSRKAESAALNNCLGKYVKLLQQDINRKVIMGGDNGHKKQIDETSSSQKESNNNNEEHTAEIVSCDVINNHMAAPKEAAAVDEENEQQQQQQQNEKNNEDPASAEDTPPSTEENNNNNTDQQQDHKFSAANIKKQLLSKFPSRKVENQFNADSPVKVTPIQKSAIIESVKKMNKHAAKSIDAWNRNILMTALVVDPSIAEDLGEIVSMIASSHTTKEDYETTPFVHFDRFTMDIVRAGRLVGIPKPEGGMRPIVIGSFLAKLTGSAILRRCGVNSIPDQFAINQPNGAKIIGHKAREYYISKEKAIIRIDIKNAYNATVRKRIVEQMTEEKMDKDLICYFNTMYQPASKLVILGRKQQHEIIESDEGIRQGDGPSSYFFCLAMRKARDIIVKTYPDNSKVHNMAYMDDTTIAVDPEIAADVTLCAIGALEQCGFEVNRDKSAIICQQPERLQQIENNNNNNEDAANNNNSSSSKFPIPIADPKLLFKMLGINITNNFEEYNEVIKERITTFFDVLDNLTIHPEIKHLILHLCGKPKLLYYCETTPPQYGREVVELFDKKAKESFATLIDIKDSNTITPEILYDKFGGNLPHYSKHHQELYSNCVANALTGGRMQNNIHGLLISSDIEKFKSPECSHDRLWTHWLNSTSTKLHQLSAHEYTTALAIRCSLVPDLISEKMGESVRCGCSTMIKVRTELARHLCSCTEMSKLEYANRHTYVKHAIRSVLTQYGVQSDNEPNYYNYTTGNCRPDITVRMVGTKNIAIDLTIVKPDPNEIGAAAKRAAETKEKIHGAAVAAFDHIFIPFALETTGHMDASCFLFFKLIRNEVQFHHRIQFQRDFFGAISTALARFRAHSMISAANQCLSGMRTI